MTVFSTFQAGPGPAPGIPGEALGISMRSPVRAPAPAAAPAPVRAPAPMAAEEGPVAAPPVRPDDTPAPLWRRALSALFTLVIVALAVLLWPAQLGGSTRLVIVSGTSMEPTYDLGDVVVTRDRGMPEVGDVVLFAVPEGGGQGTLVIHRVVDIDDTGHFITQGDNRDVQDQWLLDGDDIEGRPLLRIPAAGRLVWMLQNWLVIALLAGLLTIVLLWPDEPHEPDEQDDEQPEQAEPAPIDAPIDPEIDPEIDTAIVHPRVVVEPSFFTDDEIEALLGTTAPDDETEALPTADSWTEREIDDAVMADALAWLDAELEGLTSSPSR